MRIVALSWRHRGQLDLSFQLDGQNTRGVAVAFGFEDIGDSLPVQVRPGSVDISTFQLWREDTNSVLIQPARYGRVQVVPIDDIVRNAQGVIISASSTASPAPGAALLLDPDSPLGEADRFIVRILGDHVIDADGRAIDAEFVRSQLPTGDRPLGSPVGVQGGTFESWMFRSSIVIGGVDLNLATLGDLVGLPGIGPGLAARIIVRRELMGGFRSIDDLATVPGIGPNLLDQLRALLS